jgi:hypothetical protein
MHNERIVQELRTHLPDDFHRQLLDGSLQVLGQIDNPVRAHLFAAGLRELFGLSLETLAPDSMVRKCGWFKQMKDTAGPTRRQRALYATRGGLDDEFLRDELHLDPEDLHRGLGNAFAELHKRTHVRPETLMINSTEIEAFAKRAINALNEVFGSIRAFRKQLVDAIEEHLQREAMAALIRETILSLDELAGHHSIEAVYTDWMRVVDIDAETIRYEAGGTVDVELQWGSSSDFRNGDGAILSESFPFKCDTAAPASQPYNFYGELTNVTVDTGKWYEGLIDDN